MSSAAFSCGRRSRASAPLPVSISSNVSMSVEALGVAEAGDGVHLGVEADVAAVLREADIGDDVFHTKAYIARL